MSYYVEILAVQNPFPFAEDEHSRQMFSCNYQAMAQGAVEWEEDILAILTSAGIAIAGTNTFIGSAVAVPTGDGPFTTIIDTGGTAARESHNGDLYRRLSAQVIVRAVDYTIARARSEAIYSALHGKRNLTLS